MWWQVMWNTISGRIRSPFWKVWNAFLQKKIEYEGILLKEFDLDAALERKPELILVDDLAHRNASGCRHAKRYQDVEELLQAGINVYTTVNVQHLESLNDLVTSITGIVVNERIPDHVFDRANQVELVDIEPSDLEKRLREGKIYPCTAGKAGIAEISLLRKIWLPCGRLPCAGPQTSSTAPR